ncbi:hypothetical protein GGI07_000546 [Coemansia sp. Benny D115]|nr:hypothetical protein GGI07_000546 [Coemansia sp. Benny D115]
MRNAKVVAAKTQEYRDRLGELELQKTHEYAELKALDAKVSKREAEVREKRKACDAFGELPPDIPLAYLKLEEANNYLAQVRLECEDADSQPSAADSDSGARDSECIDNIVEEEDIADDESIEDDDTTGSPLPEMPETAASPRLRRLSEQAMRSRPMLDLCISGSQPTGQFTCVRMHQRRLKLHSKKPSPVLSCGRLSEEKGRRRIKNK